jgi:hypothetical protein
MEQAIAQLEQVVEYCRARADQEFEAAIALHTLGRLAQGRGDDAAALTLYATALLKFVALGDSGSVAWGLELAATSGGRTHPDGATRLFGAAAALRNAISLPLSAPELPDYERAVATVRDALGTSAFDAAWSAGGALSLDAVLAEVSALAMTRTA